MTQDKDLMTLKTAVSDPALERADETLGSESVDSGRTTQPPRDGGIPLMGVFAALFGLLSIFAAAPLFAPLAIIFGVIALFMGQILLGISAIGLAVIGVVTSPTLLAILSVGAFLTWLGL